VERTPSAGDQEIGIDFAAVVETRDGALLVLRD
jgi:hypothetical protein